jgi:hypothetical protein
MFQRNKWSNKEYIIIKDNSMKMAGLKLQALIKNQWRYFETIIIPDK